jgi:PAS domain S-box-containing protein
MASHPARARAEQKLHELNNRVEEQFRALVDVFGHTVWTTDAESKVVDDSPLWREFTGQTFTAWIGWRWVNAVHPGDREYATRQWARRSRPGTLMDTQFRLRHATSNSWHLTHVRAIPLRQPDGTIPSWLGTNTEEGGGGAVRGRRGDEARRCRAR